MTVLRHYLMQAAEGQSDALVAALTRVKEQFLALDGCESVDIMRDLDQPERFVMLQRWASVAAHQAAFPALPKEALGPVMAALTGPPQGSYLTVAA